jgi:hypothetical protein
VLDCEGDGLVPSKIYCMCVNTKEHGPQAFTNYDDMRDFLSKCTTLIAHNCRRWDIPVLERILGVDLQKKTIVDTLALSWYLQPERKGGHSLDSYGNEFLIFKPKINDWENLPIEDYIHRCTEDVKINTRLWNEQFIHLKKIYGNEDDCWRLIKYLSFKLWCAHLQEKSQWRIDVEATKKALERLETEKATRVLKLSQNLPKVPVRAVKRKPKRFTKSDGTLTKLGQEWLDLLTLRNLPEETEEIEVITGYQEPNPSSTQQMKDWLFSLGWKPKTFEHKKDSEGNDKEIPQINQKFGKGLDPGILDLIEEHPELEFLNGLSVLSHRIGILKSFLESEIDGYVQANVNGLTNTLRFQHVKPCVNLPKPDKLYAQDIRSALIAEPGYELCGADMSALEDKLKMHYIYPLDPEYVKSMQHKEWDPHLALAGMAGMLTPEEIEEYKLYKRTEGKEGSKHNDKIRSIAKNGNYALQYLAGVARLIKTIGVTKEIAEKLYKAYWELNSAWKEVTSQQTVKEVKGQMWLWNPVSMLWYSLRSQKDVGSTLVQGTASFVFDLWVKQVLLKREQLTAQFHDEIVLHVKQGFKQQITRTLEETINKTNDILKLNVPLSIGIQFGTNYSAIH